MPVFTFILHTTQVAALPSNKKSVTTRVYYTRRSSSNNPSGSPKIIIIAVLAAVLSIFAFFVAKEYRKRKKDKQTSTQRARSGSSDRAPDHRATINYSSVAEQADNTQIETREAEPGTNITSVRSATRQPRVNRRPSQNSSRSLPAYRERLPDGEMVLIERIERPSMSENYEGYHSGDETESTLLTVATTSHTHINADPSPEMPRAALTTSSSRAETSMSYVENRQGQPEHSEGTRPSASVTEPERVNARAPSVRRPTDTTPITTTPYGNVPTYDEVINSVADHATVPSRTRDQ